AFIHVPGDLWQQLADLDAGRLRGNGAVRTADIVGRVWLGVEGLQMAGSAVQPEEDDRRIACLAISGWLRLAGAEPVGQRQAEQADAADLQQMPAVDTGAIANGRLTEMEHGRTPHDCGCTWRSYFVKCNRCGPWEETHFGGGSSAEACKSAPAAPQSNRSFRPVSVRCHSCLAVGWLS